MRDGVPQRPVPETEIPLFQLSGLQILRGPSARLGLALGRWNPVEQTGLCIYSCFRTYRSELFNRVLLNQLTICSNIWKMQ